MIGTPNRGLVHTDVEVLDQHGETVLTLTATNPLLVGRRWPSPHLPY